jgi:hypothetical protein
VRKPVRDRRRIKMMEANTIAKSPVGVTIAKSIPRDSDRNSVVMMQHAKMRNFPKSFWYPNIRYEIMEICTASTHACQSEAVYGSDAVVAAANFICTVNA